MTDFESLNKFITEVNDFRKQTEKFLNSKIALDLIYLDKYIIQLKVYASEIGDRNFLPLLGILLKPDIDKWYMSFVERIVRNQNKTRCKVECHFGKKWNRLRKKLVDRRWIESDLYKVMNNSFSEKDRSELIEVGEILTELRMANKKQKVQANNSSDNN